MVLILIGLIFLSGTILGFLMKKYDENNKVTTPYYLASDQNSVLLTDEDGNETAFPRGTEVGIRNKRVKIEEEEYCQFAVGDVLYYVKEDMLVSERRDCVRENEVYALRDHVLSTGPGDFRIAGWVTKSQQLSVDGFNELLDDGSVDYYFVDQKGWIDGRHASIVYEDGSLDASIYADVYYGDGGSPESVDYYHKENFEAKKAMPEKVNALYINAESIQDADDYIDLAKKTEGINAFVVDIKDCYVNTQLAYDSPIAKEYAPSTSNIPNSFDEYKENVRKLKDAGYYLIGRITAFKDDSFASDNPDEALLWGENLYRYGSVVWPSIYSRKMWEYDVALALEAVDEMGFDEIQFDYVRLPEDVEGVDLRNTYDESRVEAVTAFLRYASECLHDKGVYVSADVFGEISGDSASYFSAFVSSYGQFWPAISNAVDAVSSMPYPDHFAYSAYGISEPWEDPGALMYCWGKATSHAQENTYDPAKCRTWILAQNSGAYDVYYGAEQIAAQIRGLRNAGVDDGYLTWNAASDAAKYVTYVDVLD